MRNIFITGASGFVGAHLASYYLNHDYNVVSIEHDSHPISTAKMIDVYDNINWVRGSITNPELIRRIIADYDIVEIIHVAAMSIERGGYRTTLPYFTTNVMGTVNILDAVREQSTSDFEIKMLYFSSDKAYGDLGEKDYTEDMKPNPDSIYSCSKACADMISQTYAHSFDLPISIVRCCNIYGYGDLNPRVIPNTILKCLDGKNPIIFNNLDSIREYIHVEDICHAIKLVLDNFEITNHQIYNIGSGYTRTQKECVFEILKYFPDIKPIFRNAYDYAKHELRYQKLNSEKIKKELNWLPQISFEDGIKEVIREYKNESI